MNKPVITMDKLFNVCEPLPNGDFKQTTLKTAEQAKNFMAESCVEKFIVRFVSYEGFEEKDKRKFLKKIKKALAGTGYEVREDWKTRVENGHVFDLHFETFISKSV